MVKRIKKILIDTTLLNLCLFILMHCLSTPLYSQDVICMTMEESISMALTENNQIRSMEFEKEKADWNKKRAWSVLFPSINMYTRYSNIDNKTFMERSYNPFSSLGLQMPQSVFRESYYSSINIHTPLFEGALLNGLAIADANIEMASQADKAAREEIIFQVIRSYLNIIKANDILKLQRDYLELSQMNYERAERLQRADRYSKTEALRWKVDYQLQKSIVASSESVLRNSKATLTRFLGTGLKKPFEIKKNIPTILTEKSEEIANKTDDEILEMINLSNEELIKINSSLSSIKAGEEISRLMYKNTFSSYMPSVSLDYSYAWKENNTIDLDDNRSQTLMVTCNIPIFKSFQNYTVSKTAYYDYRKTKELFSDQLQNIRYVLTNITNNIINLKNQRELSKVNVEFNEKNYNIVARRKEQGLVSNINFIDAKLNLQNAKLNHISTYYDLISSMIELYYHLGKLDTVYVKILNLK